MAVKNKKSKKKMEKDAHRRKYRIFKELRWWVAGLLAVCVAVTVWAGFDRADRNEALQGLAEGKEYRETVVITGGSTTVSLMDMCYYYYDALYTLMESDRFQSEYGAYGLDPANPLKEMDYTPLRTWFEELLNTTYEGIDDVVRYAEIAREKGTTLDAEDEKEIEDRIKELSEKASKEGTTFANYLDYRYCPGMTVEDLRSALRLYRLGEKQYGLSMDEMLDCSDEDIEAYYEANKSSLVTADYAFYKFYGEKKADLEEKAKTFTACKTKEEFMALIEKDIRAQGAGDKDVTNYLEQSVRRIDYTEKDAMSDWAFNGESEKGDTFTEYGENYCVVYWLIRPGRKITHPSANARSVLISGASFKTDAEAKKAAEDIYNKALSDGTEEYFITLAKEHSFDLNTAYYGGEYADIIPGDVVEEYENWLFSEDRKYGEIGFVKSGNDYHIIFFLRYGEPCWKVSAKNALVDARVEGFGERLESDIPLVKAESVVMEKLPDDLATDRDRNYVAVEKDGVLVYEVDDGIFSLLNVMLAISAIALVAVLWLFVETARLKKKYNYDA